MNKIDTVVIINDFNFINGGAAKVAIQTAEMLQKEGLNVYFFSAENKEKDKISGIGYITTNQKASLEDSNKIRGLMNGVWNRKAAKELKRLLESLNREKTIVHVHGWMKALSSSIFSTLKKMNFEYVVTYHDYFSSCPNGGFYNYQKNHICHLKPLGMRCITCNCDSRNYFVKIYRVIRQFVQNKIVKINEKNNNIVAISDFSYQILKDSISPKANICKIYNPIDFQENSKIKAIQNNKYYLYVGRISKEKGIVYFCEAIGRMKEKGIVVGDGPEKEKLQRKYPQIEFVGWKNNIEVKEYMKKAKFLIFPSIWYEGAPLTIIEAHSLGLPVIVSDCCAGVEFVHKDLIYKSQDVNCLIDKIEQVKNESEKWSNYVYEQFNRNQNKEYINKLIKFYNVVGAKDES